jgi:hypothetical protein
MFINVCIHIFVVGSVKSFFLHQFWICVFYEKAHESQSSRYISFLA